MDVAFEEEGSIQPDPQARPAAHLPSIQQFVDDGRLAVQVQAPEQAGIRAVARSHGGVAHRAGG